MSYIEVTGKTEEEAVRKALTQLGLERDDVSLEILERAKSGFLGIGGSPARRTSFRSSPAKFFPWWETDSDSFPLLRPLRPRSD